MARVGELRGCGQAAHARQHCDGLRDVLRFGPLPIETTAHCVQLGSCSLFAARLPILAVLPGTNCAKGSRPFPSSKPTASMVPVTHGPSNMEAKEWYACGLPHSRVFAHSDHLSPSPPCDNLLGLNSKLTVRFVAVPVYELLKLTGIHPFPVLPVAVVADAIRAPLPVDDFLWIDGSRPAVN